MCRIAQCARFSFKCALAVVTTAVPKVGCRGAVIAPASDFVLGCERKLVMTSWKVLEREQIL